MASLPTHLQGDSHVGGPTVGAIVPVAVHVASVGVSETDYTLLVVPAMAAMKVHAFSWDMASSAATTTCDIGYNSTPSGSGMTSILSAPVDLDANDNGIAKTSGTTVTIDTQDIAKDQYLVLVADTNGTGNIVNGNFIIYVEFTDGIL